MFLRSTTRIKNGKEHCYFSIVENKRVAGGRVVQRIWVMDRGIPTEKTLAAMRAGDPPISYLVGTPKGRLSRLESQLPGLSWQQVREGIEAHIFVAFLAYCLHVTLQRRLRDLGPGLTPRSVLDKFSAMQMIDVHLPTTAAREVILTRHTQPDKDQELLLRQLKLQLPEQPPPKIRALNSGSDCGSVVQTFEEPALICSHLRTVPPSNPRRQLMIVTCQRRSILAIWIETYAESLPRRCVQECMGSWTIGHGIKSAPKPGVRLGWKRGMIPEHPLDSANGSSGMEQAYLGMAGVIRIRFSAP